MSSTPVQLDGGPLTTASVRSVARDGCPVAVDPAQTPRVATAREHVARVARGDEAVYGVNTGFGSLSRVRIDADEVRAVQHNLIRSHAAGVGSDLPCDVVRAMMVILAGSLSRGCSGVRPELISGIVDLLNAGITPVVPSRGSVGASGDLAPLSHVALVLLGEGEAIVDGTRITGAQALREAGLTPLELCAKEGLALINGTHMMAAAGSLLVEDLDLLMDAAIAAGGMAIDACRATDAFLAPMLHLARNQSGQIHVAHALVEHLVGSEILESHREGDPRVQDPYCLRAMPQVLGAVVDTFDHVAYVIDAELGGVTDNPLVFVDDEDARIVAGGNFHGMPLAIALDTMSIGLAHVAGIAERRVNWLLTASDGENPVNPYLSPQPGLHSGLMITQYTAAACCNELQTLATPASVGNIPTSAGIEDYNSMGATAAHQARAAIDLATTVVAIELLVMTEAMEYQRPLRSGAGVERTYETVRSVVDRLTEDRSPAPDIRAIEQLIRSGAFASILND